jgi:3'-phosphoadenosine 5'-phosphosulfate sulfotransferase (PAPS reductase)/FAD synthetase
MPKKNEAGLNPRIASAISLLSIVRQETDTIGVAVSYGKDSLVTLDLCSRVFTKLYGYYLYRVANLEIVEEWKTKTQSRWPIEIIDYPHFDLSRCYMNSVLQPHWKNTEHVSRVKFSDIEDKFRLDTGVKWIAYGWRGNDSYSRCLIMKKCRGLDEKSLRVFPIRSFRRQDVYRYLDTMGIERPDTLGRKEQGGLDFHKGAFDALSQSDRQKWENDFPFSEVVSIDN